MGEVVGRPAVLLSGLNFPEAPRWHAGRLWFSDVRARCVMSVDETGEARVELQLETEPSGLGFLPDGSLLVVTVTEQRVLRFDHHQHVSMHADLRGLPGIADRDFLNDMVVDADGVAYVGTRVPNSGPVPPPPSDVLVRITPDGAASVVETALGGTNGMVLIDGELVLAETNSRRLSTREVRPGGLGPASDYADVEGAFPDGITADDEAGIWVASVFTGLFVRVARGGSVTDTIRPTVGEAVACELGGVDGRTLFLLCADAAALRRAWSEEQQSFVSVAGPEPTDSGTIQVMRVPIPRHRDAPR